MFSAGSEVSVARRRREDFDAESENLKVSASSAAPEAVCRRFAAGVELDDDCVAMVYELRTFLGESENEAGRFAVAEELEKVVAEGAAGMVDALDI